MRPSSKRAPRAPAGGRGGSARERGRADSRRRLLAAGRRLFVRHGVAGVNSNEIASEAGVATGTFYLHFADKHELFREIARDILEDLRAASDPLVAETDGLLESELRVRAEALLDFCETNDRLIRLAFGPDGVAGGVVQSLMDVTLATVRERIELRAGVPAGRSELPFELAVEAIAAMWVRTANWWCDHGGTADRDETVRTLVSLTLAVLEQAFPDRLPQRAAAPEPESRQHAARPRASEGGS